MLSNYGLYHDADAQGGRVNFTISRLWRAREGLPPQQAACIASFATFAVSRQLREVCALAVPARVRLLEPQALWCLSVVPGPLGWRANCGGLILWFPGALSAWCDSLLSFVLLSLDVFLADVTSL